MGSTGGPEIHDGGDQGGTGQGGDGKDDNNGGYGGSEANDGLLQGLEWWWWQWQRGRTRKSGQMDKQYGNSRPVFLADTAGQLLEAETIRSSEPVLFFLTQFFKLLVLGESSPLEAPLPFICPLLFEMPHDFVLAWHETMGAILGLFLVVPLAATWRLLRRTSHNDQHDENGDASDDEDGGLYL